MVMHDGANINGQCRAALDRLLEGNQRFVAGRPDHPNLDAERRAHLRKGQAPFAVIVGCADSRVPVELVFDQGLGDLFSVRVAGNVASQVVIGSVEYAVSVLGVKAVVVLGHEGCGAVQAALDGDTTTQAIRRILAEIEPAIAEARTQGGPILDTAVRQHARGVAGALVERSDTVRERVEAGSLIVVPLFYSLATGTVERLD